MEGKSDDLITLEIEGTPIRCSRADLIEHSDYFKAMFEGNFVEKSKTVITLNGVEPEAMNTILKLLWDREHIIDEDNILSVLQASCMLQFLEIKNLCIERVENMLSVNNCLKIWFYTEPLYVTTLSHKAKLIALLEFKFVKDTSYFLELRLDEVVNYLGNVYLQCSSELVVFEALTNWYHNLDEKTMEMLLKLLHCLDFNALKREEIDEIIASRSVSEHQTLIDTLNCVRAIKKGMNDEESDFEKDAVDGAKALFRSKSRNPHGCPCILLENVQQRNTPLRTSVVYHDKFKRKRKYDVLIQYTRPCTESVFYIDPKYSSLKKLCDMSNKCENLDGFTMSGYKQYLFLYGGEHLMGKGDWNWDFQMYDLIKEKWKKLKPLPFPRRHFETCICDKYLYIIGGTGTFRVIQENIFWYDLEENEWCFKEEKLPCSGRQIKCCSFEDKLFVLNINSKCGYTFNLQDRSWNMLTICDKENVLPFYSKNMSLFSYKSSLYIKENVLFELKAQENTLLVVNKVALPDSSGQSGVDQIESILCNNVLYSLNKQWSEEINRQTISLDSFNMDTHESAKICERTNDEVVEINNELFQFRWSLLIFNVFHYDLVTENDLINCC